MEIIYYIFYSALIAAFSYVYVIILFDAEMLLGFVYEPIIKFLNRTKLGFWLRKPLISCAYCNAGQISLWFYIIKYWGYGYNPFYHIGFITLTILLVHIMIKKIGKF